MPPDERSALRGFVARLIGFAPGNIAGAAALLGTGHISLGEWLQRRRR
jgi:hypothetical protein